MSSTQCERNLQKATRAAATFKKEATKVTKLEKSIAQQKQQLTEVTSQKEAAEYNAYIYKLVADAAIYGVDFNGKTRSVHIQDINTFKKLEQGMRGVSKDAEGNDLSQSDFMKHKDNILDVCALGKLENNDSVDSVAFPHAVATMYVLGHRGINFAKFCHENKELLSGSEIRHLSQEDYKYFAKYNAPNHVDETAADSEVISEVVSEAGLIDQSVEV